MASWFSAAGLARGDMARDAAPPSVAAQFVGESSSSARRRRRKAGREWARVSADGAIGRLDRALHDALERHQHLLDAVGLLLGGEADLADRVLSVVPHLRALVTSSPCPWEDVLRRNVALHAVADGIHVSTASTRELRAAQRGPRLARVHDVPGDGVLKGDGAFRLRLADLLPRHGEEDSCSTASGSTSISSAPSLGIMPEGWLPRGGAVPSRACVREPLHADRLPAPAAREGVPVLAEAGPLPESWAPDRVQDGGGAAGRLPAAAPAVQAAVWSPTGLGSLDPGEGLLFSGCSSRVTLPTAAGSSSGLPLLHFVAGDSEETDPEDDFEISGLFW